LTHYRALGDAPGGAGAGRRALLQRSWDVWRDATLAELSLAHPDLVPKVTRMELTRYGHAMAIPLPRNDGQIGLWPASIVNRALQEKERYPGRPLLKWDRLVFAHSDWAGYSVFEEAFTAGHAAGRALRP
jgi:hypothetical protein